MYIYVTTNFKQHQDDTLIACNNVVAKLKTETPERYSQWLVTDEALLKAFDEAQELDCNRQIETHIYQRYPDKKQKQDDKWLNSYAAKFRAAGVYDIDSVVVQCAAKVLSGSAVKATSEAAAANLDIPSMTKTYIKRMLLKLVKIAVRTEWMEQTIIEGESALRNNRKVEFPEYPEF